MTGTSVLHTGMPAQVLAPPLPAYLPTNAYWEAKDDDLRVWAPAAHVGHLGLVPGCS